MAGVVEQQEVQVYYYLEVLHTPLPAGLCSHASDGALNAMVEHVKKELNKLNTTGAPHSGG